MLRNNSVIVDLFQGQYRSRLICPTCNLVSRTFDPFMYCSLPVPQYKRCLATVSTQLLVDQMHSASTTQVVLFVPSLRGSPANHNAIWPYYVPVDISFRAEFAHRIAENAQKFHSDQVATLILKEILAQTQSTISIKNKIVAVLKRLVQQPVSKKPARSDEAFSPQSKQTLREGLDCSEIGKAVADGVLDVFSPIVPLGSIDEKLKDSEDEHRSTSDRFFGRTTETLDFIGDPYFSQILCVLKPNQPKQWVRASTKEWVGIDLLSQPLMISATVPLPVGYYLKSGSDANCLTWTWLTDGASIQDISLEGFFSSVVANQLAEGIENSLNFLRKKTSEDSERPETLKKLVGQLKKGSE